MSKEVKRDNIVYAVYPNANGFGYVYMKNARELIDFGAVRISPISNRRILDRIRRSLNYLRPSIIIVQDPGGKASRTGKRVEKLIKKIVALAEELNLKIIHYSRDQIRDVFEQFGAISKYEISQVLIKEFTELEDKLPKKRKLWTSEDRNMAIFDALSLASTWFYFEA